MSWEASDDHFHEDDEFLGPTTRNSRTAQRSVSPVIYISPAVSWNAGNGECQTAAGVANGGNCNFRGSVNLNEKRCTTYVNTFSTYQTTVASRD